MGGTTQLEVELDGQELGQLKQGICVLRFNSDRRVNIRKGGKHIDSKSNKSIIETRDYLEKQKRQDEDTTNPTTTLLSFRSLCMRTNHQ